jgi:glycosyltransferase involved in cell wall biosynthesis
MLMFLSVILPVYNESSCISRSVENLIEKIPKGNRFEIILVDDGSTDNSLEIIKNLARDNKKITFISYKKNVGRGEALTRGIRKSRGDFIMYIDADLSINPKTLEDVVDQLHKFDLVIGSKHLKESRVEYPFFRNLLSRSYSKLTSFVTRVKISDFQCGLKGFRRRAILEILDEIRCFDWSWDTEILCIAYKKGYSIKEIPVEVVVIPGRDSKVKMWRDSFIMSKNLFRIWHHLRKI